MRLTEFVSKISEPRLHPWASKNSHSKEQEMKIILSNSIFHPQKQGEVALEDYVTDCIESSSISLLLSWTCWSDPEDLFSLKFSLKILKLKALSFKNKYVKPPHPTCVQSQILKKSPTAQYEVIHWRLMLKPSSQWRLSRKPDTF